MSATTTVAGAGGAIAGGWLGRVIGGLAGSLAGPGGTAVGAWIGGQVGAMAGRATASAIASYMEGANVDADAKTKESEQAKPCVDCGEIDCFKPPKGSTPDEIKEFKRQLEEQQDAINNIPPDQLIKNMDTYEKIGRGATDAADRAAARSKWLRNKIEDLMESNGELTESAAKSAAQKELKTMDVIHTPDLSAGGTGEFSTKDGGLAPRSANRSIGSQWSKAGDSGKTRLQQLKEHAEKARQKGEKSNTKLKLCDEAGASDPDNATSGGSIGAGSGQGQGQSNIPTS
ncbi:polymorphic toxin type 15 domain-containing protein [Agrobacterium tumefaciens]